MRLKHLAPPNRLTDRKQTASREGTGAAQPATHFGRYLRCCISMLLVVVWPVWSLQGSAAWKRWTSSPPVWRRRSSSGPPRWRSTLSSGWPRGEHNAAGRPALPDAPSFNLLCQIIEKISWKHFKIALPDKKCIVVHIVISQPDGRNQATRRAHRPARAAHPDSVGNMSGM